VGGVAAATPPVIGWISGRLLHNSEGTADRNVWQRAERQGKWGKAELGWGFADKNC